MAAKRKVTVVTGTMLTKFLRSLAADVDDMNTEGDVVTKAESLAQLVWNHALGFWEKVDPDNPDKKIWRKPDWRAIALLFDRIEGKVIASVPDDKGKTLQEKVTEIGKARANSLAEATQEEVDNPD